MHYCVNSRVDLCCSDQTPHAESRYGRSHRNNNMKRLGTFSYIQIILWGAKRMGSQRSKKYAASKALAAYANCAVLDNSLRTPFML